MKPEVHNTDVAELLLQINAIKLNVHNPFTWASGLRAPIYCDNRQILSFPAARKQVSGLLAGLIRDKFPDTEVIAGVATGAIALGVLAAEQLDLPFVYVRTKAKTHGLGNSIEGKIDNKNRVCVVEDLVSTGKSSLEAVEAIRHAGATVLGMVSVFTYGLALAKEAMEQSQCPLFSLQTYDGLIERALSSGQISQQEIAILRQWQQNPQLWSENFLKK